MEKYRKKENVRAGGRAGMTLLELLTAVSVAILLTAFMGVKIHGLVQRSKVSSAKAAVSTIALALGMMRDDTGFYPLELAALKSPAPPDTQPIPGRYWNGPYLPEISLVDPWGNPYYYELIEGAVFGPNIFKREKGQGNFDVTYTFRAPPGPARIIILNEDDPVTAGEVYINGDGDDNRIVKSDDFKKIAPRIEKEITLLAENEIRIWLASQPGRTILLVLTSPLSSDTTYILGSFGRNGEIGGSGFDEEIIYGEF